MRSILNDKYFWREPALRFYAAFRAGGTSGESCRVVFADNAPTH